MANIQKMPIAESELIINPDGSIYHLKLKPEEVAPTVILVGDQNRVSKVSRYFDEVSIKRKSREFVTHTGTLNGKRISVVSTGIGTDNIDIVLNELDALVNIDFSTRLVKDKLASLNFIRIGTSGTFQKDVPVDSFLISEYGLGLDALFNFYKKEEHIDSKKLQKSIENYFQTEFNLTPHLTKGGTELIKTLGSGFQKGITATCPGFYAPQGRKLRAEPSQKNFLKTLASFKFENHRLTNFEMETAGIYGLANLLGHQAISFNAILANRATGEFSAKPGVTIRKLIKEVLGRI